MLHIIAIHSLFILAGGFIALHFVGRFPSLPLKIAAWILIIGGGFMLLCAGYLGLSHWRGGYYDHPHRFEMPYSPGPRMPEPQPEQP